MAEIIITSKGHVSTGSGEFCSLGSKPVNVEAVRNNGTKLQGFVTLEGDMKFDKKGVQPPAFTVKQVIYRKETGAHPVEVTPTVLKFADADSTDLDLDNADTLQALKQMLDKTWVKAESENARPSTPQDVAAQKVSDFKQANSAAPAAKPVMQPQAAKKPQAPKGKHA